MSKKVQKTLTAALATTLATGSMAIPAMAAPTGANSDVDALYKAAYEATIKTQNLDKVTQNDINVAREAINKLRGTSVASAVPTFSAIVDKAQQKFLEVAYNSIVKCQETGTQKDINTARTNIQDLPVQFKDPYSMAIDAVQQKVIDKVYAAVEQAIKSQKPEDIKKAQELLDDILTVVHNDGVKKWAVETEVRFKKATAVLNIVSAEALNNNTVKVLFNRAIDPKTATTENFSVSPKGGEYDNLIVSKVQVAEDGMSVKLTTINTFENKKDYVVDVSKVKDTNGNEIAEKASAEFNYQIAEVKSIEFTATNIPVGANLKNYVVIKDALGRDVTDEYKDKLSFVSENTTLVNENGIVVVTNPQEGHNKVNVTAIVDGTNVKIRKALTITKSAATTFVGYTMVNKNVSFADKTLSQIPEKDKFSYLTVGQNDAKLVLGFKDQFGKELNVLEGATTSEVDGFVISANSNPKVATIENNGTIKALSVGTTYITVKYGNIEKTISIEVKAASIPASISTSKDDYNLVATNESGININYAINDQYGNKYKGNDKVTTGGEEDTADPSRNQLITSWTITKNDNTIDNSNGSEWGTENKFRIKTDATTGQITIKPIKGKIQTGAYKLTLEREFKYDNETIRVPKTLNINVVEGGESTGYKVQIDHTKLDSTSFNDPTGIPQEANVTLYEVDADGNELNQVPFDTGRAKLEVFKDGVISQGLTVEGNKITAKKDGTYKVNVIVGNACIEQLTITVVNTESEPKCIQLSKNVTIKDKINSSNMYYTTIDNLFNNKLNPIIKNQYGENMESATISDVDYTIANAKGIKVITNKDNNLRDKIQFTGNNNGVNVSEGTIDLVVTGIKVAYGDQSKTITYSTPLVIKVKINPAEPVLQVTDKAVASNLSVTGQVETNVDLAKVSGNVIGKDQYGRDMKLDMSKIKVDASCIVSSSKSADIVIDTNGVIKKSGQVTINSVKYDDNGTEQTIALKENATLNVKATAIPLNPATKTSVDKNKEHGKSIEKGKQNTNEKKLTDNIKNQNSQTPKESTEKIK